MTGDMTTIRRIDSKFGIAILFLVLSSNVNAQFRLFKKKQVVEKTIVKTGSYVGVQAGKLYGAEIGVERQWKEKKIKKPQTVAINMGFNYAFAFENKEFKPVLGYDFGAWRKNDRISLTYGLTALARSDFNNNYMLGIAPFFGYKVLQIMHIRSGYQFLFPIYGDSFANTNLFLSARVFLRTNKTTKKKVIPMNKDNPPKKRWFNLH